MTTKQKIIQYYYEEKLNTIVISDKLKVSKQYVSKVVRTDTRFIQEKNNRKFQNAIKRKQKKNEIKKQKRLTQKIQQENAILQLQHIQASCELSDRRTINNRAFRNWNSSIYEFYNYTKEYRIKEDFKNKISYAVPKKIKWN